MYATYSPEDNKLRLYSIERLDTETYAAARELGFRWAPKQELFVAPAWTPAREDFLIGLCGEIGDEDTSLVDRAEQRAERFEVYSDKREKDAHRARAAVDRIANGIPLGQPILVGHHSEKHARKDAERIENGMRKAVKMWETSEYWTMRAVGAVHAAKYKELPGVRARRIKGLEADERKEQKRINASETFLRLWNTPGLTYQQALYIANRDYGLYDCLVREGMSADQAAAKASRKHGRVIAWAERWLSHIGNRLTYERAMLAESGYTPPVVAKREVLPLLNYPGIIAYRNMYNRGEIIRDEAHHMTKAEYSKINGDYKGTRVSECGTHRVRTAMISGSRVVMVYLTDSKTHARPGAEAVQAKAEQVEAAHALACDRKREEEMKHLAACARAREERAAQAAKGAEFAAMRGALKQGVLVVSAPQLFLTPPALAERMVELAEIEPGQRVLEPSAGTGNILKAIPAHAVKVAVEINRELAENLKWTHGVAGEFGLTTYPGDFLELNNLGTFDRVVMNPPFAHAQDIEHIKRACALLKPGGRLVALCANGPRQNAALAPLADSWEVLPSGTFNGTGVCAVLLTISI